jgi:hypothetical protein
MCAGRSGLFRPHHSPHQTISPHRSARRPDDAGGGNLLSDFQEHQASGPVLPYDTENMGATPLLNDQPERTFELAGDVIEKRMAEDAENRTLADAGERAHLGASGKAGVSKALQQKYRASLGINQRGKTRIGEARAWVGSNYPDLKGADSNRKVAEVMQEIQQKKV